MHESLDKHPESTLPGIGLEPGARAEPGRLQSGAVTLVLGVAASTAVVVHVLGDGIEGRPGSESGFGDCLSSTVLEKMKKVGPGFSGAMVVAFFSIRVDGSEVLVALLAGWLSTG